MKRCLALVTCLLINGGVAHSVWAQGQRSTVHARNATAREAVGYLGVGVAEVDEDLAKNLKLKEDRGVVVMNVSPDSPAAKAGLKQSDVILEFNGQRVEGVEQFMRLVRETPPERKVTVQINRSGAAQTVTTVLSARAKPVLGGFDFEMPDMRNFSPSPLPPMPPPNVWMPDTPKAILSWRQGLIGIEAEPVSDQLGEFFGVKEGVLVRSVNPQSPAEKAGLKAGDVVIRVGSATVRTPQDITKELRPVQRSRSTVQMAIVRNHREMSIALKPNEND